MRSIGGRIGIHSRDTVMALRSDPVSAVRIGGADPRSDGAAIHISKWATSVESISWRSHAT